MIKYIRFTILLLIIHFANYFDLARLGNTARPKCHFKLFV